MEEIVLNYQHWQDKFNPVHDPVEHIASCLVFSVIKSETVKKVQTLDERGLFKTRALVYAKPRSSLLREGLRSLTLQVGREVFDTAFITGIMVECSLQSDLLKLRVTAQSTHLYTFSGIRQIVVDMLRARYKGVRNLGIRGNLTDEEFIEQCLGELKSNYSHLLLLK
jgi:hypothetical protein